MAKYTPHAPNDVKEMLDAIGTKGVASLFEDIPQDLLYPEFSLLKEGIFEVDAERRIKNLAAKNRAYSSIFAGGGAYNHYIPSSVKALFYNSPFATAYTGGYADMSQGFLQGVYEFQEMICRLSGMQKCCTTTDVGEAAAKACMMFADGKRKKVLTSSLIKPHVKKMLSSYLTGKGLELVTIEAPAASAPMDTLMAALDESVLALYIEQPNFYGVIEDMKQVAGLCHAVDVKLITGVYPISLGVLKKPSEYDCDAVVGECSCLGMPLMYGSNNLGFIAVNQKDENLLPFGRIEKHSDNASFYVSGNVNFAQGYRAIIAGAYLAFMGREGLKDVACLSAANAHYMQFALAKAGIGLKYRNEFFNEFVTLSKCTAENILNTLAQNGILGGYKIGTHEILWCATELNSRDEMDKCAEICGEVNK